MGSSSHRARYTDLLMEKVRTDRYASSDHMDRLEAAIDDREQAREYLDVLMAKVEESRYPSKQLLDRIERLTVRP
jgi:hypothetical protein